MKDKKMKVKKMSWGFSEELVLYDNEGNEVDRTESYGLKLTACEVLNFLRQNDILEVEYVI